MKIEVFRHGKRVSTSSQTKQLKVAIQTKNSRIKIMTSQNQHFKTNSDPAQGISLCIPRVFKNIGWRRIKQHMIEANLGYVERVDVIPAGNHKRAFVHFRKNSWNMRDQMARDALKALQEGKKIKLVYEEPWYWLVSISGAKRPDEAPKPHARKVKIDLNPDLSSKAETPKNEEQEVPTSAAAAAVAAAGCGPILEAILNSTQTEPIANEEQR